MSINMVPLLDSTIAKNGSIEPFFVGIVNLVFI
ncbi:MAG: hypothetical protein RLZZ70_392 [Candidatus Parcubacteria bacterium]|jgi:hypothetical protein